MMQARTVSTGLGLALAIAVVALAGPGAAAETVVRGAETIGDPVVGVPVDVDMAALPVVPAWRPGDPIREIPRRTEGTSHAVHVPSVLDPLVGLQRAFRGPGAPLTELLSFDAASTQIPPNDPTGDVGSNYFVEAVNGSGGTNVTIYVKETGVKLLGPFTLDGLAPGGACATGWGDPIVLYDPLAERWLLTEFSQTGNRLCVYTSRTRDPTAGSWCFYQYTDNVFPDYPKYAVWPDAYVATANEGDAPPVYAFDRENMLSPDGTTCPTARAPQKLTAPGLPGLDFEAFTPVDLDGPPPPDGAPAYVVRHRDEELNGDGGASPTTDRLELWSLDVDWDVPGNTELAQLPDVIVADFDSGLCPFPLSPFVCVPQKGTSQRLDAIVEIVMNRASYRNFGTHESIMAVFQTDVGDFENHVGERWVEMRKTGGGAWQLFQEGTYSPDATHRFIGTTAMDGEGNVLLAYNASSPSVFPSLRYTGRLATDPAGIMSVPETTLAPGGAPNSSSRYGDYNQMGVDPEDECTFWFLGMYNPSLMAVRVGAVRFDSCVGRRVLREGFEGGAFDGWDEVIEPL